MVLTLNGCGYNGFTQVSGFQTLGVKGWTSASDTDGVNKFDSETAITKPLTLLRLVESVQVHRVVFTWARIAATLKKDGKSLSLIVGGKESLSSTLEREERESVCGTDSHILLRGEAKAEQSFECLNDGEVQPQPIVIRDELPNSDVLRLYSCHNEIFYSRGTMEYGKFTSEREIHNGNFPMTVHLSPLDMSLCIEKISCGKEHVLFLSQFGSVYSSGLGSRGQLGHGDVEMEKTPRLIEALEGLRMCDIDAGGWHSASVSEPGDVYTWGWNESGQLGVTGVGTHSESRASPPGLVTEPECVTLSQDIPIKAVVCGSRHTLLLSACGQVFTSGWNAYGQLGLMHTTSQNTFVKVISLRSTCKQIFAGQWCSFFVCYE